MEWTLSQRIGPNWVFLLENTPSSWDEVVKGDLAVPPLSPMMFRSLVCAATGPEINQIHAVTYRD